MTSTRSLEALKNGELDKLFELAWEVRENAHIIGPTKVGCAVLSTDGRIFLGCNVEHRFRSHDVHAEVNAIASMISRGATAIRAIAIAAERERFTPCGACMDWIMQFSNGQCVVAAQAQRGGPIQFFSAHDLMPYYPF